MYVREHYTSLSTAFNKAVNKASLLCKRGENFQMQFQRSFKDAHTYIEYCSDDYYDVLVHNVTLYHGKLSVKTVRIRQDMSIRNIASCLLSLVFIYFVIKTDCD